MKKYHIHKDGNSQGPFSLEELIEFRITHETMIWFEGADNWCKASEVIEIREVLKSVPPPMQSDSIKMPPSFNIETFKDVKKPIKETQRKKKYKTFIFILAVLLIGGLGTFVLISEKVKQEEIEQAKQVEIEQAKQAEIQRQIEEQNTKLQEQSLKLQEQERIESERNAEEERRQNQATTTMLMNDLAYFQQQYDKAVTALQAAKIRYNEIQKYKLLRSASEKQKQLQNQLYIIRSWEIEIDRLKKEIDQY